MTAKIIFQWLITEFGNYSFSNVKLFTGFQN